MKRHLPLVLIVLSIFLIGSCVQPVAPVSEGSISAKVAPAGFKVVGYAASWQGTAEEIEYNKLTHINYAFAIPDTEGNIIDLGDAQKLRRIVELAHQSGVKVLIACGGWSYKDVKLDPTFTTLAANATSRENLVNNLVALVDEYNLDGVDMDWEYPDTWDNSHQTYEALMVSLGNKLHAKGKLLTAAVSGASWGGGALTDAALAAMDFINVMAYDGDAGAGHSPMSYAQSALNYYLNTRKLSKNKVVLGVPFYSRPGWKPWHELVKMGPGVLNQDLYNGEYYNGIPTIQAKTELAINTAGGVMIWELSHDTHDETSLLGAIAQKVLGYNPTSTPTPTLDPNLTPTPTATSTPIPFHPWDSSKVYIKHDVCSHNGVKYEAQWWTQGDEPGAAVPNPNPWKVYDGGTSATPTPIATATQGPSATPTVTPTQGATATPTATTVVSPTPTATATATATQGTGPAEWQLNATYTAGNVVSYQGSTYVCLVTHTAYSEGWNPASAPTLWSPQS